MGCNFGLTMCNNSTNIATRIAHAATEKQGWPVDHYPIIQALCRAALAQGGPAVRQQIERLIEAAKKSGDDTAAKSLRQLLSSASRANDMAPSRLTRSRGIRLGGEELTPNTPVPVDKETASPLADIVFADALPASMPLFDPVLTQAATTLVHEWRNADALEAVGVAPSRTCLIYGPPGTGKTSLAMWLARELGLPAVVIRLDGLISSFLGTTARNVGNLFAFANRYRCALLLDEFDAVAKVRDDPHEVGEIKRVVNALLQNLDARNTIGITLAITNHEGLLDPAIWRRFEIQLRVPKPQFAQRLAITRANLPPTDIGDPSERLVAWLTDGMAGSDVQTFVRGLKKHLILNAHNNETFVSALQHLVAAKGSTMPAPHAEVISKAEQQIALALTKDPELEFTQSDVGHVLNRDKATISRWLRT